MYRLAIQLLSTTLLTFLFVGCGGGGDSSTATTPIAFGASSIAADCVGTGCSATTSGSINTYSGSGTGVWRFNNTASVQAIGTLDIEGLAAGKTVTLIYSNSSPDTNASTAPSPGILAAPATQPITTPLASGLDPKAIMPIAGLDHTSHHRILEANRRAMSDMRWDAVSTESSKSVRINAAPAVPISVTVGSIKDWSENAFGSGGNTQPVIPITYSTTAKVVCPAGTLGRKVVIWVQTSSYPSLITASKLTDYQNSFCGTNNNDGRYAQVANAIGDVWGPVPSTYSATTISDTISQKQDVNIVIIDPGMGATWGGYFYSLNNRLKTTSPAYANSNEALLFFVNARQSTSYTQSVLIHELTHMINYYQRWILNNDQYETWLEETTAMMTQDIFDLGLTLSGGACVPIVCDLRSYAASGAGISYFNWPFDTISNNHYYMGASFGAYLNRRFGPHIYLQLTTDCYTAPANTSGRTCLDLLIKANGGNSFDEEFARFGASVFGRMGGVGEPVNFGFPSKSGTVALKTTNGAGIISPNFNYNLPAINSWWSGLAMPATPTITSLPYSAHVYRVDTVASGKTNYVRNNVSIPAKTSLTVIVK